VFGVRSVNMFRRRWRTRALRKSRVAMLKGLSTKSLPDGWKSDAAQC
jgi:hypothetical protein